MSTSPILAAARASFARAHYDVCRTLLSAATPGSKTEAGKIALLAAFASDALGDGDAWFAAATDAVRDLEMDPCRATALASRARAAKATNNLGDARADLVEANREIEKLSGLEAGSARYQLALEAFESSDLARAEELAKENLASATLEPASAALLGDVALKRERYTEADAFYASALRKLRESRNDDIALEARALAGIAWIAASTADVRALERVRKAFSKRSLPETLAAQRWSILTSLRFGSLLQNDLRAAFFEAREAALVAPDVASRVISEVQAGVTSGLLGDRSAETLHFARAWNFVRTRKWTIADARGPIAILIFVIDAAHALPAEARKAMAIYRGAALEVARTGFSIDHRTLAFEAMAAARVEENAGDAVSAERFYRKSLDLFAALGLSVRAALTALDLRRLTGDEAFVAPISAVLERAPQAWFSAQLADLDGPLSRLSPAELVVLAHLIRGDTTKAIGQKMDRSPFTISNHTRHIFAAFGVNSRARVMAICAERGIAPESVERLAR